MSRNPVTLSEKDIRLVWHDLLLVTPYYWLVLRHHLFFLLHYLSRYPGQTDRSMIPRSSFFSSSVMGTNFALSQALGPQLASMKSPCTFEDNSQWLCKSLECCRMNLFWPYSLKNNQIF